MFTSGCEETDLYTRPRSSICKCETTEYIEEKSRHSPAESGGTKQIIFTRCQLQSGEATLSKTPLLEMPFQLLQA